MRREITVSVDVFAYIWAARLASEETEDEILRRLLKVERKYPARSEVMASHPAETPTSRAQPKSSPQSGKWSDVLIWTLEQLGGRATLADIYRKSREGRAALGMRNTREHDASARECLESHCEGSEKYREKADLFWMPEGKGKGIWALKNMGSQN